MLEETADAASPRLRPAEPPQAAGERPPAGEPRQPEGSAPPAPDKGDRPDEVLLLALRKREKGRADDAHDASAGRDGEESRPGPSTGGEAREAKKPGGPGGDDDRPDEAGQSDQEGGSKDGETSEGDENENRGVLDFVRAHKLGVAIGAVVLVAAIVAGVFWYLAARHWESTDDAFVDSRVFSISPKVSGYLVEVPVTDNQHVDAGAIVARVDPRDYEVALAQANGQVEAGEAAVASAKAQLEAQQSMIAEARAEVVQAQAAENFAVDENKRAQELVERGVGTVQRSQQTASQLAQAQASLARARAALNAALRQVAVLEAQGKSAEATLTQAKAQRDQALLNLSYTTVRADQAGRVSRLTAAKGQLVQSGQALSMFVPDTLWVTANYKETQLTDMRPGQEVVMTIDAYPDRELKGKVDSIQRGSGTVFSLLPAQNATGNYVKVVQRVPVKLTFDEVPTDVAVGPGMSVVPKVRVR